jgi:beta-galactosidase
MSREPPLSRRAVLRTGALGGAAASLAAGCGPSTPPRSHSSHGSHGSHGSSRPAAQSGPVQTYSFNQGWLFGGGYVTGSENPGFDDSGFAAITLPHTVTPLSWGNWDPASWEQIWIYRKHFALPVPAGTRVLVDFDGVMVNAAVAINGTPLAPHVGGYLPFTAELTGHLADGDNTLAVIVDSRWLQVPPEGAPAGAAAVDYLQPGGIYRDVTLRVVPEIFLSDVFARPADVLTAAPSVQVQATIDAAVVPRGPVRVTAELRDGRKVLAVTDTQVTIAATGTATAGLAITGFRDITLWSPDTPKLYTVAATVAPPGAPPHTVEVPVGFREATFELDGFYLNGRRLPIFGLNRHQLFPYIGMAAAARLQRRDAEILKNELNCNMVRCSHYPQSPHFLDACDELGLMIWEEPPGWVYVGDAAWQDIVVANVSDMVIRDRSRPSVIVWATRLNETENYRALYAQTRQLAYQLDGSRQTTGAMTFYSTADWAEDVFAYDDYHAAGGNATLEPPLPGVPYLVSESVGALDGPPTYRWIDSGAVLAKQALLHAQVHDIAQSQDRYAGLLGWAGIDYASLVGGNKIWDTLKTPGVLDTFRVPKPGAAFYQSQVDPRVRPVVLPVFFWDFGPDSPGGPGRDAMIATNCQQLQIYLGGAHHATAYPDRDRFPSLAYPPAFADLSVDGSGLPELRIDGYVHGRLVASARMSADISNDRLALTADDGSIAADGTDTTRLTFRALDQYGNQRARATGRVRLSLAGPATLIGDNPFDLARYGGVGGAFVRSRPGKTGKVTVTAEHDVLGRATVTIAVMPAGSAQL